MSTNEIADTMFKHYDHSIPFDDRAKLPRKKPHPFVAGYVLAVLEDWPFHVINDITERTYAQMIRDCGAFFWRNRDELGKLSLIYDVPMKEMGRCFWQSRNGDFGFGMKDWPYAEKLHESAERGFGPIWIVEQDNGQLDYVWEDPDDTGFNFE